MARYTFRLPDIGEGITEAEIVAWHVKVGDSVSDDDQIADMMTDKATVEMESPVSGTIVELAGEVGDMVPIGSPLVIIETSDVPEVAEEPAAELSAEEGGGAVAPLAAGEGDMAPAPDMPLSPTLAPEGEGEKREMPLSTIPSPQAENAKVAPPSAARAVLASPAVRARARDLGIDLAQVRADGDRVRHADLDAYLRYGSSQGYGPPATSAHREDEAVKVIGMRRRIAENMAAAKRHIPHFTYVEEIDVTALEDMRAQLNAHRGERPKLTMLPLLIAAICRAIPAFPMINARYDDEAGVVTRHGAVHLGMATQTDAGLMVPVIRDAQDRNVWQLAMEIARLAEAARTGKAKSEELSGSTLTVTSLGPLGGIATTPVINRPEVAIIGPNRVVERPVIRDGEIAVAKLMNLSISCDHRVVDGWDAASFVQELKRLIEAPATIFVH